jgi:hypothetical protein
MDRVQWLRAYWGVVGAIVFGTNLLLFLAADGDVLFSTLELLGIWLGAAFLYAAIALPTLLETAPLFLRCLLAAAVGLLGLEFLVHWLSGAVLGQDLMKLAIALALTIHLWTQLHKALRQVHIQQQKLAYLRQHTPRTKTPTH